MSGTIGTGFNNFGANFGMISNDLYKQSVDFYAGFTEQSHDFQKMLSKMATDLDKLKRKYSQTNSESLARVIQQKEQLMAQLGQTYDEAREGYFEKGNAIQQEVAAYLGVSITA